LVCLLFSISGENKHYGTPTNPVVNERIPGGSSSGAAVAVAANLVDFSLGELLISVQQLTFLPLNFISLGL
jgi:Asp-tRNA(Asn)/Glu-tRNA(Gln) amidotransferase A subunit family amidase